MLNKLKHWLLFQPLKQKIVWVIMTIVIMTVVSITGFLYWHNDQQYRQNFILNNLILVKLVGQYTTLPLVFNDATGATEQLNKLLQDPRIAYARLENVYGEVIMDFDPVALAQDAPSIEAPQEYVWQANYLYFNIAIQHNQQLLGVLKGAFRLDEYQHAQRLEIVFMLSVVLVAVVASFMLSLLLRRFVMVSIQQLELHTRRIARQPGVDDPLFYYPKRRNDEISRLYEAFNELIQEVRNREAEILQLNADLENKIKQRTKDLSDALKIKSAFLANMSHEIRTPMNAFLGMLHLVLQTDLSPKQINYITKANDATKWLLGIINDILDYSKLESGKINLELTAFKLEILVNHLEYMAMSLLQDKPVVLQFEVDPDIPVLVGDQLRLGQILINLISNAVKFTASGRITVRIQRLRQAADVVSLRFSVHDTGIGISQEQKHYLFDPFMQADTSTTRRYGGTGLGLTICKELVEAMGGQIELESQVGVGSCFFFVLEFGISSAMLIDSASPAAGGDQQWSLLAGMRLLVVEDNPVNQELVQEVLSGHGVAVDLADNGAQAVTLVEKNDYDAVLMDCLMPIMDGFVATRIIRKNPRLAQLPIIAMTANVMTDERRQCLASGMNDHIGKPIHWEQLLEILARWVKLKPAATGGEVRSRLDAAATTDEFPVLTGVDRNMARKFVSGNARLYWKILYVLHDKHTDTLQEIEAAYAVGDYKTAAQQAHALSGVLSTIGALPLSNVFKALQDQLDEHTESGAIKRLLDQAAVGFNTLLREIDQLCRPGAGQTLYQDDVQRLQARAMAVQKRTLEAAGAADAHSRYLILLVEEDKARQTAMMGTLGQAGFDCVTANNDADALKGLQQQAFDAIVMDMRLPVMQVVETIRRIRALPQGQRLPIIALTAAAHQREMEAALADGLNAQIARQDDPESWLNVLMTVMGPHKPTAEETPALWSPAEVLSQLEQMARSFENYEAISLTGLHTFCEIIQSQFSNRQVRLLVQYIEQYDYASALTVIRAMIAQLKTTYAK